MNNQTSLTFQVVPVENGFFIRVTPGDPHHGGYILGPNCYVARDAKELMTLLTMLTTPLTTHLSTPVRGKK